MGLSVPSRPPRKSRKWVYMLVGSISEGGRQSALKRSWPVREMEVVHFQTEMYLAGMFRAISYMPGYGLQMMPGDAGLPSVQRMDRP